MSISTIELTRVFAAEQGRLMRLIQRIVRNRAAAEELVQDTFLNVLRQPPDRAEIEQPGHYLARAARNLALNYLRSGRHAIEVPIKDELRDAIADPAPSPERICVYRGELRYLLSVLAKLSWRRRQVFALHKFDGLSYGQIGAKLGISRNTVMVHMVNAMAELDRRLDREFRAFE